MPSKTGRQSDDTSVQRQGVTLAPEARRRTVGGGRTHLIYQSLRHRLPFKFSGGPEVEKHAGTLTLRLVSFGSKLDN